MNERMKELKIMKTNIFNTSMIQYTKYIWAIVLMLGMSISAWGTTLHYGAGGSSTMTYTAPTPLPGVDDVGQWDAMGIWMKSPVVSRDDYPDYSEYYSDNATNYSGEDDLYALYMHKTTYKLSTQPVACTSQGVIVKDNSDEDEGEGDYGTLTSFNLSVLSDGSGAVTWSTSDANVATVSGDRSGAVVTVVGAGLADITASVAADATYCAGEGTYSLLVNAVAPTLSHNASGKELTVSGITSTGATFTGGVVTNKGGLDITRYGFTIGTSATVVIGGTGANAPVASGFWDDDIALNTAFGSKTSVSNFSPNTTYYVRAFAYNGSVYGYSTAVQFKTLKQYSIDLEGGDGSDGLASVEENSTSIEVLTAPTRDHYTLEGYYTTSGCDTKIANTAGELVASITVGGNNWTDGDGKWIRNADETFYANWTPDNQTISFNANGGSGSMDNVVRAYNTTYNLPACTFTAPDGKVFDGWAEGSAGGTVRAVGYSHTVTANITFYAKWRAGSYTDAKFSCADWTLTGPSGNIVFITSAASKTVRSQEAFHVSGSGLPHSTALTFSILPVSSKFAILKADGTIPSTNEYGVVDADVYVFYTPDAGDTSDGLDEFTSLTVSVTGEPRTATINTKRVIGRHIATDFVIAAKYNNKWYALPATMTSTSNPTPVEIAVDDLNNPTIAYTASSNIYNLYGQKSTNDGTGSGQLYTDNGVTVKFGMKNNDDRALYASSTGNTTISGAAVTITNNIGIAHWWTLIQTNGSVAASEEATYTIQPSNNTYSMSAWFTAGGGPKWGLYANGNGEHSLRLIPASDIPFTEAEVVEWGQHSAILEVDATGIDATSVIAHLGEESSAAITLSQTRTSVKNGATKYDYTVHFGDDIDFADAASNGAMLTLEWKKGETVKAMSNIVVPKIIAASATMSSLIATDDPWNSADVHVLPGVTLTANAGDFSSKDVVVDRMEIYPGATVKVTRGAQDVGTLKVRTLVLRNGWTRVGEKAYDVARMYVSSDANLAKNANDNVWYSDWYIDYDQYYPIAVPFPVATSTISYKNTKSTATAGVRLRYYSGKLRAEHIQENQDANWVEYTWGGTMPANLQPSHGYIMTAKRPSGKAFSIVRMPMTFSNEWAALGEKGVVGETHKDTVYVKAWGDENTTPSYAKGWNIIANPYMALHQGELSYTDGGDIQYANIPDISFKEYDQLPIDVTKLKPSTAFLVQAPKDGFVTFGATNRLASVPSYRREVKDETLPTQKAYIVLASEDAEDMMGIWISDKYSAEYEINADLEKLLGDGNSLRTYMLFNDMKMAYLAINQELAEQLIPVNVRIATTGEHIFSMHSASKVSELEGVYLTDYRTGDVTNLLEDSYPFNAEAGTISGRFALNAKVGKRPVPTDLDIVDGDIHGNQPIKFLYNDKVYILHNGVIYDATGKKVRGK